MPLFTEELDKIKFQFEPQYVTLFIENKVIKLIRGIRDDKSEDL